MSMEQLTILQFVVVFCIYTGLTVVLPAILLYPKVSCCRTATRFFVYFTAGNFYFMNLVYVLELCHISCWLTLVLGTVLPAGILYVKTRNVSLWEHLHASIGRLNRILRGSYGVKSWLWHTCRRFLFSVGRGLRFVFRSLRSHWLDALLAVLVSAVIFGYYGSALIENLGYCASDVTVHNYWINYLGKNEIFVAGVYPFGFHNIVYYIHAVFGIDTFAILRVFWLAQTFWIHMVLLMFLKGACRSRFLPYAGVIIFVIGGYDYGCYWRYGASLPQEFGMLFILPAVHFAFEFFRIKKEELKGIREKNASKWYLVGFALNFAMTFSVHFYGTIILGFFCVGIACGYMWRFLQPKYFIKVVKTCFLGLAIALLPMVAAYLSGTPLEGSLRWAVSVMTPSDTEETEQKEYDENGIPIGAPIVEMEDGTLAYEDTLPSGAKVYYPVEDQDITQGDTDTPMEENHSGQQGITDEETQEMQTPSPRQRLEMAVGRLKQKARIVDAAVELFQFDSTAKEMRYLIYLALLATPFLALLLLFMRRPDEAFSLIAAAVHVVLLILMLAAPDLGLPAVMQQTRICIYLSYMMIVLWVLAADRALYAALGVWRLKWMRHLMNIASFAAAVAACAFLIRLGWLKPEIQLEQFQTNEAITCLTNIIHEEKDFSWTIVSAYDEMRLGQDHGYHEELNTLLKKMEYTGGISMVTLPSKTVYFFIEKKPIDYLEPYENSGQMIGEEGAKRALPTGDSFENYKGENRWILMSRIYEWAQAFQKQHPYDMTVYFENEDFVCYRLVQNEYHLFNLSIDYGYNMQF